LCATHGDAPAAIDHASSAGTSITWYRLTPAAVAAIMRDALASTPDVDVARTVEETRRLYSTILASPVSRL
jgi:hypothetical protein